MRPKTSDTVRCAPPNAPASTFGEEEGIGWTVGQSVRGVVSILYYLLIFMRCSSEKE